MAVSEGFSPQRKLSTNKGFNKGILLATFAGSVLLPFVPAQMGGGGRGAAKDGPWEEGGVVKGGGAKEGGAVKEGPLRKGLSRREGLSRKEGLLRRGCQGRSGC